MDAVINPNDVLRALVHQVSIASKGRNEQGVVTLITRPMWRLFCIGCGMPEDCEPTPWLGMQKTRRVYGSETIIVPGDDYRAVSFLM